MSSALATSTVSAKPEDASGRNTGRDFVRVEVVYALPQRQALLKIRVPRGTTAREAIKLSGIRGQFPEIDLETAPLGIFGTKIKVDRALNEGDRVEIYRPLKADPREVRRQLAAEGKTMGRRKKS